MSAGRGGSGAAGPRFGEPRGCLRRAGAPPLRLDAGKGPQWAVPSPVTGPCREARCPLGLSPLGPGVSLEPLWASPPLGLLLLLLPSPEYPPLSTLPRVPSPVSSCPSLPLGTSERGSPAVPRPCSPSRSCAFRDVTSMCTSLGSIFCSCSPGLNYCMIKIVNSGLT